MNSTTASFPAPQPRLCGLCEEPATFDDSYSECCNESELFVPFGK